MRILERNLHLGFNTFGARSSALTAVIVRWRSLTPSPKERFKEIAEASAETPAEIVEVDVHASPPGRRSELDTVLPVWAELIVTLALVGIREHLIRFVDLFEALFGPAIPGIQIRVILSGELAVGLPDLVVRSVPLNPQSLVIVLKLHSAQAPGKSLPKHYAANPSESQNEDNIKYESLLVKFQLAPSGFLLK
jgi:hypothetical protein